MPDYNFYQIFRNLTLLVFLAGVSTFAGNKTYSVTGVAENDSLNIRETDNPQSKVTGKIPYNAGGITLLSKSDPGRSPVWGKIRYRNYTGWVNMRFLRTDASVNFRENIRCLGTEPFWNMILASGNIELKFPMDESRSFRLQKVQQSANNTNQWFIEGRSSDNEVISVYLIEQSCSDDMSDNVYKYRVLLNAGNSRGNFTISGCCNAQ